MINKKILKTMLVIILITLFPLLVWMVGFKIALFMQDAWGCTAPGSIRNTGQCINIFDIVALPVGLVISIVGWVSVYIFVVKKILKKINGK